MQLHESQRRRVPLSPYPPLGHVRSIVTRRESSEGGAQESKPFGARRGVRRKKCQGNTKPQMNANERRFKSTVRRKYFKKKCSCFAFFASFAVKSANLIINILIYFLARGYVSDAAFMNSRGGASSCPHIRPWVTSAAS